MEENRSLKGKGLEGDVLSRSLSRRAFLAKLALVAGGSALALAPIPTSGPPTSLTPGSTVAAPETSETPAASENAMIEEGPVEFDANGTTLLGYLSRPASPGPHPAVVVVHENRG